MKFHYTYRLTAVNPIDERVEYIGVRSSSTTPDADCAYIGSSRYVAKAFEHGVVFEKEIIEVWPTRKAAVAHEIELHAKLDVGASPKFFNRAKQTCEGFDVAGTKLSTEVREHLSKVHTNRLRDPEARAKMSEKSKEVCERLGGRDRMVKMMLDYYGSEENRKKHKEAVRFAFAEMSANSQLKNEWLGVRNTSAYKEKQAVFNRELAARQDVREKLSKSAKARMSNPELRARLSEATKKQMQDPAVRALISEKSRQQMSDPATRAHLSAKAKEQMANPEMIRLLREKQSAIQSIKKRFVELSGYTGNKRSVTVAQAETWLKNHNYA